MTRLSTEAAPAQAGQSAEAVLAMLRLLASEAPLSTVHAVVERAMAGVAEDERGVWHDMAGAAARLWEIMSERKHREQEMLALFDTASDLTSSLQDTDELLDRIVQRARQRFASDACYLVLTYPESGQARVRVTAGAAGAAIDQAHLPWGAGLVGVMKKSGRPYFSSNYLADPNLVHEPGVDAFATDEGIVSIAGAPLRMGDDMLGALFVAHRHARMFTDAELNLLASLANHAAIVLEKASTFEAMSHTLEDLRRANAAIEHHAKALERAGVIHEQLTRLVLAGSDLRELARTVANVLDADVVLADSALQVRAESPEAAVATVLERNGLDLTGLFAMLRDADSAAAESVAGVDGRTVWVAPVRAGADLLGALILSTAHALGAADVRTVERSAQTAAVLVLIERTMTQAEEQVRGEFVDDLLGERAPDWASIERRARRIGLSPSESHVVLVASCGTEHRRRLAQVANTFARDHRGVAGEWQGDVVLLVRHDDADACARRASADLARGVRVPVTVGAAGPVRSLPALRDAYHDAVQCHHVLPAMGRSGQGASLGSLGMFGVLIETSSEARLQSYVDNVLGPVARYDAENGTQLIETLDRYYADRSNPRMAAKYLHLHTNTVYQRLERIESLFAPADWRSPEQALEIQLALKLRRILSADRRTES